MYLNQNSEMINLQSGICTHEISMIISSFCFQVGLIHVFFLFLFFLFFLSFFSAPLFLLGSMQLVCVQLRLALDKQQKHFVSLSFF